MLFQTWKASLPEVPAADTSNADVSDKDEASSFRVKLVTKQRRMHEAAECCDIPVMYCMSSCDAFHLRVFGQRGAFQFSITFFLSTFVFKRFTP